MAKVNPAKTVFLREMEVLKTQLSEVARNYFESVILATRVNKSEAYRSDRMRACIFDFLKSNVGKWFDREAIAEAIADDSRIENSDWIYNEKGELKVQSVTSFCSALVAQGNGIEKTEIKGTKGESGKVKYRFKG